MDDLKARIQSLDVSILQLSKQRDSLELGDEREAVVDQIIHHTDEKLELIQQVSFLQSRCDEVTYYTNTADILFKYYDLTEYGNGNDAQSKVLLNQSENTQNSILKYFGQSTSTNKDKDKDNVPQDTSCTKINIKTDLYNSDTSRGSLLDKYMSYIDDTYIRDVQKDSCESCQACGCKDMIVMTNDGYIFCSECNTIEYIIVDHEKPSYRDPPKEISYFAYKRINHFNEWLSKIQGKETTIIPEEVYDRILLEIKKQKITNMAELNFTKIKEILKRLGLNKFYEHSAHIINRLNGLPMPNLSQELEEKLRSMFKQIQPLFVKYAQVNRKNFLSYAYVIRKFIQLLVHDEYLVNFPLLKSRTVLYEQDQVWKKICEELKWQFIPSL